MNPIVQREYTLAEPCRAFVTQFNSLMGSGRGTRGHGGTMQARLYTEEISHMTGQSTEGPTGDKVDLDRGVPAGVVDVAGSDLLDGHDGIESIGSGMAMGGR